MSGPFTRIAVDVTFLRQLAPPLTAAAPLPAGMSLVRLPRPTVSFYRYLYDTVGGAYVWWLRRTMPDGQISSLLSDPRVSIHVLYQDHEPAGFFELESTGADTVNIAYFGLLPHAVGHGAGRPFLRAAIDECWRRGPRAVTVNTCTADHPRALPNYLAAGFEKIRTVHEIWDVPNRLGLAVPQRLRV